MIKITREFLILFFVIFSALMLQAKPLLTKSKYLIATFTDNGNGVVSPATGTYQLVYNADRNEGNALESDYWIIKNINGNHYTFQNAVSGKYIQYNASSGDRSALQLVDGLLSDNSTSFTFELKQNNGVNYYIIRSVLNNLKLWNRRVSVSGSVYPVGVYNGTGLPNEQFVFYDSEGNGVLDDGQISAPQPNANRTLGSFQSYLTSFTFNNQFPIVDTQKKEFYLSIPLISMNSINRMIVKYSAVVSTHKLYINNTLVNSNTEFNFGYVNAKSKYTLEIKNGTTVVASGTLIFSSLPLVQLYSDQNIGNVYNLARIAVTEPERADSTKMLLTNIKTRGGISAGYAKKSFAVNLRDSTGVNPGDYSFFNLRNDNSWILDAMYIDPARMRNRVSTDLWNDFATKPYWSVLEPKMRNGTRGRFVEVFMNDAYHGLYCMTEKIDRGQLNLKKLKVVTDTITNVTTYTQRGGLYKGVSWSSAVMMGYPYGSTTYPSYNNNSFSWSAYECKYPELDEGEPIIWNNLYNALKIPNTYYSSDAIFRNTVEDAFDLPVYLDYYLFIELLLATDNHGKNTYSAIYDQSVSSKVSITPWDLDGTWGIRWDGSKNITLPKQDFDNFVIYNEHGQINLYLRLENLDYNGWKSSQLKDRYLELRRTSFNRDSLISRFQTYADQFTISGADAREISKWGGYGLVKDISAEMTYLSNWITQRLEYLDVQYLGGIYTSTDEIKPILQFGPNPVIDILNISGLQPSQTVTIYSLQGELMQQLIADQSTISVDMTSFPAGIYILRVGDKSMKIVRK